ncbi:MAG TPA: SET domain-containing protein [Streptosporangiaceae bacterium]|nr:SET domain-containing protein [Streptosporangiaceae bacterium]
MQDAEYEPVMLFINHSCEPNVGFAGNIVLVAMRDISPGEELTTDSQPAGPSPMSQTSSVCDTQTRRAAGAN